MASMPSAQYVEFVTSASLSVCDQWGPTMVRAEARKCLQAACSSAVSCCWKMLRRGSGCTLVVRPAMSFHRLQL